jgi:hypothetical protein
MGQIIRKLVEELEYIHNVWQPCVAHMVNLVLKARAKFREVDVIVKVRKKSTDFS